MPPPPVNAGGAKKRASVILRRRDSLCSFAFLPDSLEDCMLASEKFASTGDGTKLTLPFPIYINDLTRSMQADGWFFRVITVQWNLLLRHNFEFLFPERPLVRRADSMRNIVVRRKGVSHFLFPCCDCIIARYVSVVNTLFTINIVFSIFLFSFGYTA